MRRNQLCIAAALFLGLPSCFLSVSESDWESGSSSAWTEEKRSRAGVEPAEPAVSEEAPAAGEDRAGKVRLAEMELELARLSSSMSLAEAKGSLIAAQVKLQAAEEGLSRFAELERATEISTAQLGVDRAAQRALEQRLELEQMVSTYEKYGDEDYAQLNAELIVGRERKQVEFAERDLELARRRFELKAERELGAKERELEHAAEEAQRAVESARRGLEKAELAGRLAVLKSKRELQEAREKPSDAASEAEEEGEKSK